MGHEMNLKTYIKVYTQAENAYKKEGFDAMMKCLGFFLIYVDMTEDEAREIADRIVNKEKKNDQ